MRRHTPRTVGDLIRGDWRNIFDAEQWIVFSVVLATLASRGLQNSRPRDQRLRSLEQKVLIVFEGAGLPFRASQYAADILAEIKEYALGTLIPRMAEARLKALRDAVRRRSNQAP